MKHRHDTAHATAHLPLAVPGLGAVSRCRCRAVGAWLPMRSSESVACARPGGVWRGWFDGRWGGGSIFWGRSSS